MARLIGPSEASRLVFTIPTSGTSKGLLKSKALRPATYYVDLDPTAAPTAEMLTQLADIRTTAGVAYTDSTVTIDAYSLLPLMQFPDGVDSLLVTCDGGPPSRVYAREDDQIDALETRMTAVEAGGSGDALLLHKAGAESITGVKTFTAEPVVPTPTVGTSPVTKTYADAGDAASVATAAADATSKVTAEAATRLSADAALSTRLTAVEAGGSGDALLLHKAGAESITGVKTFTAEPVVPTPTVGTSPARKDYVDTAVSTEASTRAAGDTSAVSTAAADATSKANAAQSAAIAAAATDATTKANAAQAAAIAASAQRASNLADLASASAARANLGLGGSATLNVGTTTGTVAAGDDSRITGAAQKSANLSDVGNAATSRTNLGLGNVDNTSDANKPISTATSTALAGKQSALGIYSPTDPQWGYISGTDLAAPTQAIINAMPATGGRIIIPPGINWTFSTPVTIKTGVEIHGLGRVSTKITGTLGVLTWSSNTYSTSIRDITLQANGGHLMTPNGNYSLVGNQISACELVQTSPSYSIMSFLVDRDYIGNVVQDCVLQRSGTATVPGWHVANAGSGSNGNRWLRIDAGSQDCTSTPFWLVDSTATTNYHYDNRFQDITGERNPGGLVHSYSGVNTVIDNVVDYDASVNYTDDVIKIGKSATGGLRSRNCYVANSGRRGGTLGAGVYDVNIVSGGSFYTTVINPSHQASACRINFSQADSVTVLSVAPSALPSGYPADARHFFGTAPIFNNGLYVGNVRSSGGAGSPEGSVSGSPGDKYVSTDGMDWLKVSGIATNTGWKSLQYISGYEAGNSDSLGLGQFVPRLERITSAGVGVTSGTMYLVYFTADKSELIQTLTAYTGSVAAAATPTLCKMAIFSEATNGDITLISDTPNDTALFAATNTGYAKSLSTPWNKVVGLRYAVGLLVVTAAATPTFHGLQLTATGVMNTLLRVTPAQTGRVTGLTDIPTGTTVAASITGVQSKILTRLS